MPMVTRSNWPAPVEMSVVTLSRTWFSGRTSRFKLIPGCDDSNSPLSCSSVFICGLPTMATLTVPLAPPPAGLAAAAPAVVGAAAAVVGAAAGALAGGGAAAGAQAAAIRPSAAGSEAAAKRQRGAPTIRSRTASIGLLLPLVPNGSRGSPNCLAPRARRYPCACQAVSGPARRSRRRRRAGLRPRRRAADRRGHARARAAGVQLLERRAQLGHPGLVVAQVAKDPPHAQQRP